MQFSLSSGECLGDIPQTWQAIGTGGSGTVYKNVKKLRGAVVKLYHTTPKDYAATHEAKVLAMLQVLPANVLSANKVVQLAWPTDVVFDHSGRFRGFVMPDIDFARSFSLTQVSMPRHRQRLSIPESPLFRLIVARNLTSVIRGVHKSGHHVIDVKPKNTRIYRHDHPTSPGFVALLDCDGFAIHGTDGRSYPAGFATDEWLNPKIALSKHGREALQKYAREQDLYALAVILFQLLNSNIHPFQGVDDTNRAARHPAEIKDRARVRPSLYAYGLQSHRFVRPLPGSLHHWFDPTLRAFFDRSFTDALSPPETLDWIRLLERLSDKRNKCLRDKPQHWRLGQQCGQCAQQKQSKPPKKTASLSSALSRSTATKQPTTTSIAGGSATTLWGWIAATLVGSLLSIIFALLVVIA